MINISASGFAHVLTILGTLAASITAAVMTPDPASALTAAVAFLAAVSATGLMFGWTRLSTDATLAETDIGKLIPAISAVSKAFEEHGASMAEMQRRLDAIHPLA